MKHLLEEYSDNLQAQDLIRLINYTNESVFLTGKAGTGKSTLLVKLLKHLRKSHVVLAPTGIAALNIEGQTLHSFFQFEHRPYLPNDKDITLLTSKEDLLYNIDLIIIDEISMVRSDLMNAVDLALRINLRKDYPFAGTQLLLIGDLFQLPPVVDNKNKEEVEILNTNYHTPYFFSAKAFEGGFQYHILELEKVYRQQDETFIQLLNRIRDNNLEPSHLAQLNQRYNPAHSSKEQHSEIILATTNAIVKNTNQKELQKLDGELFEFIAESTGDFQEGNNQRKLPADDILWLKEESRVMFIKNDPEKRWVNGSLGKVVFINDAEIEVKLDSNDETYEVKKVIWESYEYVWNQEEEKIEKKVKGTFTQFPLKLAWAVTIHKSQGQSFNKIVVNMGSGAFATGQTYVALSRCRSFEGITLKSRINRQDIRVDNRIVNFLNSKNNKLMERERFESIIRGMQEKLNLIESENKHLLTAVKELDQHKSQLQKMLSDSLESQRTQDSLINSLKGDNDILRMDMLPIKRRYSNLKIINVCLIAFSLFLLYKLIF